MQFAICNEIFKGWKLEEVMTFAAKTGYEGIEIAPFTLANYVSEIPVEQRLQIADTAKRLGLIVTGIHWVLANTEGFHLTHPDAEVRKRTAEYLTALVTFCQDIGGNIVVVGSPKQRSLLTGVTQEQGWEWARQTFGPAVRRAMELGVTICLEPLSSTETNFINTAAEALHFTQWFRSPSFQIMLDVKAMCSETKPIPDIIRSSWPHFAYVHANDRNLKGPGFGDVDFKPIVAALKEVDYQGFVSVEVFDFTEGPEVIATRSLDYLKKTSAAVPAY